MVSIVVAILAVATAVGMFVYKKRKSDEDSMFRRGVRNTFSDYSAGSSFASITSYQSGY